MDRETVREKLHLKSIQTSIHYPSVHRFSIYENNYVELPKTDYVSNREITLPMYSSLKSKEVDYISNSLIEILK